MKIENNNGYNCSRLIFNWSFENPEKSNPTVVSLYLFFVEVNNRLNWKPTFGITANECMNAIGISSYNTYKKAFDLLVEIDFVKVIKPSVNQYQCNIIALSYFKKALNTPLDNAIIMHSTKQSESTQQITSNIHKQLNKETTKQLNNKNKKNNYDFSIFSEIEKTEIMKWINFRIEIKKPLSNSALQLLKNDIDKNGLDYLKIQIENSIKNGWQGLFPLKDFIIDKPKQKKLQNFVTYNLLYSLPKTEPIESPEAWLNGDYAKIDKRQFDKYKFFTREIEV